NAQRMQVVQGEQAGDEVIVGEAAEQLSSRGAGGGRKLYQARQPGGVQIENPLNELAHPARQPRIGTPFQRVEQRLDAGDAFAELGTGARAHVCTSSFSCTPNI